MEGWVCANVYAVRGFTKCHLIQLRLVVLFGDINLNTVLYILYASVDNGYVVGILVEVVKWGILNSTQATESIQKPSR